MVKSALDGSHATPISEKLRSTLQYLERLTLAPKDVGPEDVVKLRAAGVSDRAIEDAILICALFNMLDRIADALGFAVPSLEGFGRAAQHLLKHGYD